MTKQWTTASRGGSSDCSRIVGGLEKPVRLPGTCETRHFVLNDPAFAPTGESDDFSAPYGLLQHMAQRRGV